MQFYGGGGLKDFNVETPWVDACGANKPGAPAWVSDEVTELISVLKKASLNLSYLRQNRMDGGTPPHFTLQSWEQLTRLLMTFFQGVPLYGTHIDLKNAFWSFILTESARMVFRMR